MEGTRIFENEYVSCYFDESIPVLHHCWMCQPSDEQFQENLTTILDIYISKKGEYPDLKWLADTTLLGEVTETIEKWLADTWDKLLFDEAGLKVHAVVLGSNIFADYPMEAFQRSSTKKHEEQGVRLGVFPDVTKAYVWLQQH